MANGTRIHSRKAFMDSKLETIMAEHGPELERLAARASRCAAAGQRLTIEPFADAVFGQGTQLASLYPDPAECGPECSCEGVGMVELEPGAGWSPCPDRQARLGVAA